MFEEGKPQEVQIEEIYAATWENLYRFIYYKVQNREEAEDITQETYMRALPHLQKSGMRAEKCIGFLRVVSMNVLRDRWRKRKRQGTNVGFDTVNPEDTAVDDLTEVSAQRAQIINALGRLTEEQRIVIELRIIKGYSAAETARMMGKKEGTVRVIQYRGLQALAAILRNSN